jgi:hypothetical protein
MVQRLIRLSSKEMPVKKASMASAEIKLPFTPVKKLDKTWAIN